MKDSRKLREHIAGSLLDGQGVRGAKLLAAEEFDVRPTHAELDRVVKSVTRGLKEITTPGKYR